MNNQVIDLFKYALGKSEELQEAEAEAEAMKYEYVVIFLTRGEIVG